ncbi:MAG TPA: hypothetical protein VKT51_12210 [Candidatus Eremiobacteraceae bacterium]|nr:hypothetical protein [Candidatus Eremiobacteraceae bacterium]
MRSSFLRRLSGHRGRTALFVAVTAGAVCAAAFIVPAVARGRANPNLTVAGQTQFVDNVDAYAVQGVVGGQNNATAIEGFVTNASATFDNAIFGYTVAPSGNAVIGIAQPSSGTATALVGYSYRGYGVIGQTPYTGATVAGVLGQDLSGTSTSNAGVMGTTTAGYGITGSGTGSLGYGGNFNASGSGGYGLYSSSSLSYGGYFASSTLDGIYSYTFNDPHSSGYSAYGVEGVDASSDTAGTTNSGVFGYSTYGTGLTGQSGAASGTALAGSGVIGITNNDSSATGATIQYGTKGVDNDPNPGSFDAGAYGSTINGYGVEAISSTYIGSLGYSNGYIGGEFETGSTGNPALIAYAANSNSSLEPVFEALGSGFTPLFSVAGDGSAVAAGSITQFGSPLIATRTQGGSAEIAYGSRETRPTIEDVGEGNLVGGSAYVPIDHAFGATIDPNVNYLVFVTPQGDTQGLYVTGKTHAGFYVREHGGSSNIAFDYRIVAKPVFDNEARLPDARTLPALAHFMMQTARVKEQSAASLIAQDRRMRTDLANRMLTADKLAKEHATIKYNLAREAQLRKMKVPHVPTPAELHVPGTTPH